MIDPAHAVSLPGDSAIRGRPLAAQLADWAGQDEAKAALATLVQRMADAAIPLANRLALGRLPGDPTALVGTNLSGDRQKALDVGAHDHYAAALCGLSVAQLLSEEAEEIAILDPKGRFDVAIDPIDGSGSIGIGAPLGVLFCVFPSAGSFLRAGRDILAAGYVSFGHTVDFGFSVGEGVAIATLDRRNGVFHVDEENVAIPEDSATIAFNASNMRRWSPGFRRYVEDIIAGQDGPRQRDFNMRWIAAAVGDLHRILRRGGVFLYPADDRPGNADGFLRLVYEAFPIAFLIEQAGGAASDGTRPILDLVPSDPHGRVPLAFGSRREMAALHDTIATSDR